MKTLRTLLSATALVLVAGAASYSSAIPCDPGLIGAVLRYQWTVAFTSDSPCPLSANISLSDRLDVTILE